MGLAQALEEALESGRVRSPKELASFKLEQARKLGLGRLPGNAELLSMLRPETRRRWRAVLRRKPMRTASGVAVVAVQTSPSWCPHGTCTFCPGGPPTQSAKSYTGYEPAARRAAQHAFDPYAQTAARIRQLREGGHDTDKIDLILMGGTLTARSLDYQQWFVKRCLDAMNDDGTPSCNRLGGPGSLLLEEAVSRNETAANRCIGVTVETKPDWAQSDQLDAVLAFGTTRIELGVQTTHDDVLARVNRGHDVAESVAATRRVKDAGLKLCYHMMPGLPGSTPQRDVEAFARVFEDPDFRPDMVKIYPTLVIPGTRLYEDYKAGGYRPYSTEEAAGVVAECKRRVPPWVRIQRVDRDIPVPQIAAGVDKSNLRQLALERLRADGGVCRCIRCREVGLNGQEADVSDAAIRRTEYGASGGVEVFLAAESPSTGLLVGFVRLRRVGSPERPELSSGAAVVRELKVYGTVAPLGRHPMSSVQHQGWGQRLMQAAEDEARDWGLSECHVLPGIGVRQYYRRLGYSLVGEGPYMRKSLA